jgi:carbon starvation protein
LVFPDAFTLHSEAPISPAISGQTIALSPTSYRAQPGSAWGTFTIACTIPIALFVGLYMHKIRPGKIIEASLIGGGLTLLATFLGAWVSHTGWGQFCFNLSDTTVVWSMAVYGFVAAVLPVWVLLVPRDYLSSFLKIGTIILLVVGTLIANPKLEAPAFNHVFAHGGPIVPGNIFPFLFITIMCGAISGFHSLVSSGTTPKMIRKESDARMIGYGAMLIEGLVAVVAMVAAATLPSGDYYAMNTDLNAVPKWQNQIILVGSSVDHLQLYEENTQESLRGRTGGAVTLAVGMAHIFDEAAGRVWSGSEARLKAAWKYWYHFAIMFEALFILTTIDAGTRIGRFLLQEVMGKIHPKLGQTSWLPGTLFSTGAIVLGWVYFIQSGSMRDIWPMFGISNQMLAVIALAIVSSYLANEGRARYLWATVIPMLVVATTTTTAAAEMLANLWGNTLVPQFENPHPVGSNAFWAIVHAGSQAGLIVAMLVCGAIIVISSAMRIWSVINQTAQREAGFFVAAR